MCVCIYIYMCVCVCIYMYVCSGGGFEFDDRFRGNLSPSFGLPKSSQKQPQLSIVSTGFCLSTAQLCKDHSARKYCTMLGAN